MMSLLVPIPNDRDLRYLRRSFTRHLAADGRSAATRAAYSAAISIIGRNEEMGEGPAESVADQERGTDQ